MFLIFRSVLNMKNATGLYEMKTINAKDYIL